MYRPVFLALAMAVVPGVTFAQFPSGSGANTGRTSNSGATNSGGAAATGATSSGTASGSFGSASTSMFGNGSSKTTQNALSNAGQGRLSATPGEFGNLSATVGNTGFVGANTGGNFIGGNRLATQGMQSAMQQAFQGFSRGSGGSGRNSQSSNAQPKLGLRPTQRIAFEFPSTPATAVPSRASSRLTSVMTRRPALKGITTSADDSGRLVLRGTVATDEARELAAALVRLEPGVGEVVNELEVAPPAPR